MTNLVSFLIQQPKLTKMDNLFFIGEGFTMGHGPLLKCKRMNDISISQEKTEAILDFLYGFRGVHTICLKNRYFLYFPVKRENTIKSREANAPTYSAYASV